MGQREGREREGERGEGVGREGREGEEERGEKQEGEKGVGVNKLFLIKTAMGMLKLKTTKCWYDVYDRHKRSYIAR